MRSGRFNALLVLAAVLAPCTFNDAELTGGGTAAVAEPEPVIPGAEYGTESVEEHEEAAEASGSDSEGLQGDSGESRPADGDEA